MIIYLRCLWEITKRLHFLWIEIRDVNRRFNRYTGVGGAARWERDFRQDLARDAEKSGKRARTICRDDLQTLMKERDTWRDEHFKMLGIKS